jgi:hypothetical protein
MKPLQALLALFAFAFLPLNAASLADLTYTTTDGEVTITDCDEAATGELVIPNTIEGNPVTSIGDWAFNNCTSLTSITIGNSVTSIGDYAFLRCTSLTSITIPDNVTSIGNDTFYNCSSLTTIEVGAENVNYADVNGVLFNKEKTVLHTYPAGKTGDNYVIANSVTSIGYYAFFQCTSLTSITIPDSVTSIGESAFYKCTNLTSVTIPDGVTSIGRGAFDSCSSLTSITFMGAAPTVGGNAFYGVADGAVAVLTGENLGSYKWNGLTLTDADQSDTIAQLEAQLAQMTAERDARPTQTAYDTAVAESRVAGQGDVTTNPSNYSLTTSEAYNTIVAERDARFTEDQIRNMSVDHTVGQNEAGNMQVKIGFIQSADLNTYTPFTVIPDSLSVVDGKICMEFPPSDDENFFFRFRIE